MNNDPTRTPTEAEVNAAAKEIVEAFAATDTDRYFAGFAPDASFIFHPEPARLDSRKAYEDEWASWLADGWRVVSCASSDSLTQVFPGGAAFSHTVHTTVSVNGEEESYVERESIIFRTEGSGLIAVHEHLSSLTGEDA